MNQTSSKMRNKKYKKAKSQENEKTSRNQALQKKSHQRECEKRDKYLNPVRELKKKIQNMKMTIIPFVIGALGTVSKLLVQRLKDLEIKGRVEAVHTTALLI